MTRKRHKPEEIDAKSRHVEAKDGATQAGHGVGARSAGTRARQPRIAAATGQYRQPPRSGRLLALDLLRRLDPTMGLDFDPARLHRLWHLALEVNDQQTVLQARAHYFDGGR
ncbi:MAG: hypothetical protein JWO24_640 [Rhodospirillales bacterium]|nr:hypothetical protein [Rhodospirillales bacterium]